MSGQKENPIKKVGWLCTYTPEEIIHAAGFTPHRLLPGPGAGNGPVEDALPGNICPYPRKILSNLRSGSYDGLAGMIVPNSCNAMIHLYNVLNEESGPFVYLLDIPRRQDERAINYYSEELELLADYLGEKGDPVNAENLTRSLNIYRQRGTLLDQYSRLYGLGALSQDRAGLYRLAIEAANTEPEAFIKKLSGMLEGGQGKIGATGAARGGGNLPALLLAGSLPPQGLLELLSEQSELLLYPENCSGIRYLQKPGPPAFSGSNLSRKEILHAISGNYLKKLPCPRVFNRRAREDYYCRLLDERAVRAVIYHDLLFCDMCHYDYLLLKDLLETRDIPHLKVKTELGQEDLGQLKTRVEAFLEILA